MTVIAVTTGSRLHFGPLSVAAPSGGRFGGVGVMIDSPRTVLSVEQADADAVEADEATAQRVLEFLNRIRQSLPEGSSSHWRVVVKQTIPSHRGFGSGTQLGLALAKAITLLNGESQNNLPSLARRVGRGLRSAIGLYGFEQGGFLIDGGRVASDQIGTLVSRIDYPSEWRFVLAAPRQSAGLSGVAEEAAFAQQPAMPHSLTGQLCQIVLMDWLPGVIEGDFQRCSESMFEFGHKVGQFFSIAQGGVFSDRRMAEWAALVQRRGIRGIAQTSWGPTIAAHCPNQQVAEQLQRDFTSDGSWSDCTFDIATPLNHGASVSVT